MLAADPARFFKLGPERLSCTVEADSEVVRSHLEFLSHTLGRLAPQINPSEQFSITWAQRRKELMEATADDGSDLVNGRFLVLA